MNTFANLNLTFVALSLVGFIDTLINTNIIHQPLSSAPTPKDLTAFATVVAAALTFKQPMSDVRLSP